MYKQPITDPGKNSKKGLLSLERDENGQFVTIQEGRGSADKVSKGDKGDKLLGHKRDDAVDAQRSRY